jgi:hypothetical protein
MWRRRDALALSLILLYKIVSETAENAKFFCACGGLFASGGACGGLSIPAHLKTSVCTHLGHPDRDGQP